jgi:hypothetical protein
VPGLLIAMSQQDSSFFTRTSQSEGEYADGWSMDATPQTIRCEAPVIYTSQMSNYEDMRECYQKYLSHGDKAKYYDCIRRCIAKKIEGVDPEAGQAFLKTIGLEGEKDSIIRLCQQEKWQRDRLKGYGAAFAISAGASLLLSLSQGRSLANSTSLISGVTIGAAGVLAVMAANHLTQK